MLTKNLKRAVCTLLSFLMMCSLMSFAPMFTTTAKAASTDWFKDSGYGLFCHWTNKSYNEDGSRVDYYTAVNNFDVNRFANQVEEAGAKFVIFTITHESHHLAFPSAVMDSIASGHTTGSRDLYADMYTALNAKGIKMMFYWNSAAYTTALNDSEYYNNTKWATDSAYFAQKQYDLVEEISLRYGNKIAGWWVDTCYDNDSRLPSDCRNWGAKFNYSTFASKLRAGNPNSIVTFNYRWKYWGCNWGQGIEDYQAGEEGLDNNFLPTSRYSGEGNTQWFATDACDDPNWAHVTPGTITPRWTDSKVITYIQNVMSNQGVYAYNCALYQDGRIADATMTQLRAVKSAIRGNGLENGAYYKIVSKYLNTQYLNCTNDQYETYGGCYWANTRINDNGDNEIWQAQDQGDGYWKFVNKARPSVCLQICGEQYLTYPGAYWVAVTPTSWNTDNQRWQVVDMRGGYKTLISKILGGPALQLGGEIYNGDSNAFWAPATPASWNTNQQQWQFIKQ
jgi:alpha-L-fucosidase